MTYPTSLDVQNGAWAHLPVEGEADDRSDEQQMRDHLLRDLALAIHYDRVMPTQAEHAPPRSGGSEPYMSGTDADGEQTATVLREIHALLGEQAVAELRAAAVHLADTKPGQ